MSAHAAMHLHRSSPSGHARRTATSRARVFALSALTLPALALFVPVLTAPAHADAALSITTDYPAIATQPGSTVKVNLTVSAPVTEVVDLAVQGLPTGWTSTVRGGGFVISAVTAAPDTPPAVSLELHVPPDADAGDHVVEVVGTDASGATTSTQLTVSVQAQVDAGIGVTADFPSLTGAPASTFTYTLTVTNDTPSSQTFTFEPSGPQGWTVAAAPAAQAKANTVTVDAGGNTTVQVTAQPPDTAAEGSYPVDVVVSAASGGTGKIELTAQVTGTPKLEIATADQRLDVKGEANTEHQIQLVLGNSGTAALTDVKFAATPPTGWTVTFEPSTVPEVKPNETTQVIATVHPPKDAVAGDYAIGIRASAGSESSSLDIRYSVTRSRVLGVVAVALVLVALGGVYAVFRRYGRR
jgi:uncharacterized membrane protein